MVLSIALFAFLIYVSGLAVIQIATGRYRLDFEMHVAATGVGLATFGLITAVFGLLDVPLAWHWYAAATLGLFVAGSLRDILSKEVSAKARAKVDFFTPEMWPLVAAIGLAALLFALYVHGALFTPWLIDDDSWNHAVAAKHVAINQTYHVDVSVRARMAGYLEPYPVAYPVLMGVLHQVQLMGKQAMGSVAWTLKFFNALIVSLGIVYFYLMMKQWTLSPKRALWMTGVLFAIPCFMSHFIWAQSLALVLFFPAFWAMEKARGEPRWNIVAAIVVAGILLSQPSSAFAFVLMAAIYWIVNLAMADRGPIPYGQPSPSEGRFKLEEGLWQLGGLVLGGALSLIYYIPEIAKFSWRLFLETTTRTRYESIGFNMPGVGASVHYTPWDFIWAPASTQINQPIGMGPVLFLVFAASLVWWCMGRRETAASRLRMIVLAWLIFTTVGILANYLPVRVRLFPHRFWAFFAIPVAIIAGDGLARAVEGVRGRTVVLAVVAGGFLGAALGLWGFGPALYGLTEFPVAGTILISAILCSMAAVVAVGLGAHAVTREKTPARELRVWLILIAVVAGVGLTSGWAKARFEGFAWWEPGTEWYRARVKGPDGTVQVEQIELLTWVRLRASLAPNTPVLGITSTDRRVIGSDMYERPLDDDLRTLREELKDLPLDRIDTGEAKKIYDFAVARKAPLVVVDYYWAARPQRTQALAQARRVEIRESVGMTPEREMQLVRRMVTPTPREQTVLPLIEAQLVREQQGVEAERQALLRVEQLKKSFAESGYFEKLPQTEQGGLTLYQVKPPKPDTEK